jgi:quercetin dioxygenase-like cupin family protein
MAPAPKFCVNADSVRPYSPANHTGTVNRRLIGPETVGAKQLEVVLGVVEKGKGAQPHSHPGIEQVCYMLEGRARAEVAGQVMDLGPGDCCFFPADAPHVFTVTSDQPVKVLVIYAPPYGESPEKATRHGS